MKTEKNVMETKSENQDLMERLERLEKALKSQSGESAAVMSENYVIIRGQASGVFAGELVERVGREVSLNNCRRLWYWSGAASLSQLAVDGTSKPKECKFTVETPTHVILDAIEVIPCTKEAQKSIREIAAWKA